jgi:hypothetical protein
VVAGVHHAQEERLPAHPAGEDLEALGELLRDEGERLRGERLEVGGGDALGPGEGVGEALLGDEAQLVEARAQAAPVEDLVLDGLLQLSVRDDPAIAQDPSQYGQRAPP